MCLPQVTVPLGTFQPAVASNNKKVHTVYWMSLSYADYVTVMQRLAN